MVLKCQSHWKILLPSKNFLKHIQPINFAWCASYPVIETVFKYLKMSYIQLLYCFLFIFLGMEYTETSLKLAKDAVDILRIFVTDCRSYIRNTSSSRPSIDSNLILTVRLTINYSMKFCCSNMKFNFCRRH